MSRHFRSYQEEPPKLIGSREAAEYLGFASLKSFLNFLHQKRRAGYPVTTYRRGRNVLFVKSDLFQYLPVEESSRKLRKVG